jgi:hypothetical protein
LAVAENQPDAIRFEQNRMSIQSAFLDLSDRVLDLIHADPAESSEARFTELALHLFALQWQHLPVYQRFCEARGAGPGNIRDWRLIPALSARAFKEFELTALPPADRTRVFKSSGSTREQRSRHFHSAESLRLYEASLASGFHRHLLAEAPRTLTLLMLTPSPARAPESSLVHMFDTVRRQFEFAESFFLGGLGAEGTWSVDLEDASRRLRHCEAEDQPVLIVGTAFSFVHLLDYLEEQGVSVALPQGSRAMETGGYKGRSRSVQRAELHAMISERLGIAPGNLVSEYGMSELSSQAYDRAAGEDPVSVGPRVFRFPSWARARIISPETGQEVDEGKAGLVQVLDLANVYSLMAVQTEDLAIRRGPGFELLGRAAAVEPRGCSLMAF